MSSMTLLCRSLLVCTTKPYNVHSVASRNGLSSIRNFRSQVRPNKKRNFSAQSSRVVEGTVQEAGGRVSTRIGDNVGRAVLAGASIVGIGSLCYYGLGLSSETGAIDRAVFWPTEVRQRIQSTYTYFASGLGMTAMAAVGASRAQSVMRFMVTRPLLSGVTFLVCSIGSAVLCMSLPYTPETVPAKMGAFALFSSIMGATLAPMALIGGPLVARAALYTAGVVGGLSLTAACAPSEKYLYMSGPLSLGLGVVLVASIGGMFARPGTMIFSGLHAVYMYGGLVLFGGFLLYDTQKIIHNAENRAHYDPVNNAMGIYLDTLNIFIRIFYLLAGSSGNRRK